METLFTQAHGLAAPWRVAHVDFQQAAGRIVFTVECTAKRLACP
ncbi:transposase, IS204/IS1001/IS1096/IS1165 family protein, partial [Rhodanobacter sp. 115]